MFMDLKLIELKSISTLKLLIVLFHLKSSTNLKSLSISVVDCFQCANDFYKISLDFFLAIAIFSLLLLFLAIAIFSLLLLFLAIAIFSLLPFLCYCHFFDICSGLSFKEIFP
jgi:hypothetical protein